MLHINNKYIVIILELTDLSLLKRVCSLLWEFLDIIAGFCINYKSVNSNTVRWC